MEIKINTSNEDYLEVNGNKIYVPRTLYVPLLEEHNKKPENSAITQFAGISKLPGFYGSVGLPDFHAGYALPIGSASAIDLEDSNASISPDGVGFDINCGVRCLRTNIMLKDFTVELRHKLADILVQEIPLIYQDAKLDKANNESFKLTMEDLNSILDRGMEYLKDIGLASEDDLACTESRGSLSGNSRLVYQCAKSKGFNQMGTIGGGNHYLEVQVVEKILDKNIADKMNIFENQTLVSIHTGSRKLGFECCAEIMKDIKKDKRESDKDLLKAEFREVSQNEFLSKEEKLFEYNLIKQKHKKTQANDETSEGVSFIPYNSLLGKKYVSLMYSAANFAWANRSIITDKVRKSFKKLFENASLEMVYDVSHNVAKIEDDINGKKILVHRKGASRVLPPKHIELPGKYKDIGQPVLIGGSMGTYSYLIVGAEGCHKTYFSTCHGAGRSVTRSEAKTKFDYDSVINFMKSEGIILRAASESGVVEESPQCYKDVNLVVEHSEKMGITKSVCRLKPLLVIKG